MNKTILSKNNNKSKLNSTLRTISRNKLWSYDNSLYIKYYFYKHLNYNGVKILF
jgi:hypothetical protein